MNTIVPLISSGTAGPLGVLHLPRLWLKVSLEVEGKLAAGYPGIGNGFDQMVIDALGLKNDALRVFIDEKHPTYPQFEEWVRAQPDVKLDAASIEALNASIRGYNHDDATRQAILAEAGIDDDENAPKDAISLNNIDDWAEFHNAELD